MKPEERKFQIACQEERLSPEEYIEFLKRTALGLQYPRERFEERIKKLVHNMGCVAPAQIPQPCMRNLLRIPPSSRGIKLCKIAFALPEKIRYNIQCDQKKQNHSKKRVALCVKPASGPHAFFF